MFIIGELINGMYKDIGKAIQTKDKSIIQNKAIEQIKAGADILVMRHPKAVELVRKHIDELMKE